MPSTSKNFNPSKTLIQLFVFVIIIGTILLKLPGATVKPIGIVDALFTATSAVCVTGLTVKETGTFFTTFGQIIILILIQIGALGYMSLASLLVILLRRGMSIKGRLLMQQQMSGTKSIKLSKFIFRVAILIFSMEFLGAVILGFRMKNIYYGIFHSISAFCNAGFDIFGGASLTSVRDDFLITTVVILLVVFGGIGYFVINDIFEYIKSLKAKNRHRISVHTRIVLTTTLILLVVSTVVFFISEFNNPATLKALPYAQKWMMAFFQAVTPRTAGFSMIEVSGLINFSIMFTIILMFIGASPGGTGGGIKTTTFALLFANVKSVIQDEQDVYMFKKRIADATIRNTVALFLLAISFIILVTLLITVFEDFGIGRILFEVTSAFGTVGLSTGITSQLSIMSKLLITVTMLLGRVGPLTVGSALLKRVKKVSYRYPEQKVAVG